MLEIQNIPRDPYYTHKAAPDNRVILKQTQTKVPPPQQTNSLSLKLQRKRYKFFESVVPPLVSPPYLFRGLVGARAALLSLLAPGNEEARSALCVSCGAARELSWLRCVRARAQPAERGSHALSAIASSQIVGLRQQAGTPYTTVAYIPTRVFILTMASLSGISKKTKNKKNVN